MHSEGPSGILRLDCSSVMGIAEVLLAIGTRGATAASISSKTCCLTPASSTTLSMTKPQGAKSESDRASRVAGRPLFL